jgi:DNA mismatch endonuclease (patch repair protein)
MADRLTTEQRRRCMQSNRGKDTSPEIRLRRALHALGYRYSLRKRLPGRPDIVFTARRIVIFVDGCFWHGCPRHGQLPATNREMWRNKLDQNMKRDLRVNHELKQLGWRVIRVWEHDIRHSFERKLRSITKQLDTY